MKRNINRLIFSLRTLWLWIADNIIAPNYMRWEDVEMGREVKFYGRPLVRRKGDGLIRLGNRVSLSSRPTSNPLQIRCPCSFSLLKAGACIDIGEDCGLSGTVICAAESITIGNRVHIGANCTIVDSDFHPISPEQRREHPTKNALSKPIIIEDDVFIGTQAIILKGSHIGKESVVGAGAVVSGVFPPRSIIAGNPAQIIKTIPR